MQTMKIEKNTTLMIAHRGVSKLERENTCAAFVAAGNRSYYGIETDIRKTLDGKFIIHHDSSVLRLTGADLTVEECTLEQLRTLRMKDWDENPRSDLVLPTLEEYLRICKKYEQTAVVELKNSILPEDIPAVLEIAGNEGWLEHTVFISFHLENMIRLRELLPEQPLQYLTKIVTPEVLEALSAYRLDLDAAQAGITAEQVAQVHALGRKVNVWTVDDPARASQLIDMGVDYITTNILE